MASALNKRQQARNERTLQELIKTVPGNDTCADCGARNPGWASWSLGVFLCMRCAALHRKLGTHISKVKSLSMDKWDNAQVDNMKRIGNRESNKTFNPRNVKAQIPIDIDEVDSAMERFIRQKYEQRAFMNDSRPGTRQNTGSTSSVEDKPPPLPPKPTRRFGFGLQKTASLPKNVTPPISPAIAHFGTDNSPPTVNKPSRVFGSSVTRSGDGLEAKLAALREMGFPDDKRNYNVLKSVGGNVDRAVEALIALGEQNVGPSGSAAPPPPPAKSNVNGFSLDRTRTTPTPTAKDMNPFDALDLVAPAATAPAAQPQQVSLQTQHLPNGGSYAQTTSPINPYNPFMAPAQQSQFQQQQIQHAPAYQQQGLEQSFQNMQLNQPTQQQQHLFPNRTGGYDQNSQYQQTNPFQHSFTPPPMPPMPQYPFHTTQQQYPTPISPTSTGNPFLKSARSQIFHPPQPQSLNPFLANNNPNPTSPISQGNPNPWAAQPISQPNPWQHQQQQNQPQHQHRQFNPQLPPQQQYFQPQQQPMAAGPGAFNKSSILALYNYPQLAPQAPVSATSTAAPAAAPAQGQSQVPAPDAAVPGSLNPFAAQGQTQQGQGQGQQQSGAAGLNRGGHVSHESVDFAGLMGGRHSPDAFSGLSSTFRR